MSSLLKFQDQGPSAFFEKNLFVRIFEYFEKGLLLKVTKNFLAEVYFRPTIETLLKRDSKKRY